MLPACCSADNTLGELAFVDSDNFISFEKPSNVNTMLIFYNNNTHRIVAKPLWAKPLWACTHRHHVLMYRNDGQPGKAK